MHRTTIRSLVLLGAATGLAACGVTADYVYSPERSDVFIDGVPASRYQVPPERPEGEVRVASFGTTVLATADQGSVTALHVRMVVDNEGDDTPWTLDTGQQLVQIQGEGQSRPLFVNSNVPGLPVATIARHQPRIFDFYFPLPAGVESDAELPTFSFLWQVESAARAVSERTRFSRVEVGEPPATDVVLVTGWGPYWWYNPLYPGLVFVHRPPVFVHRPPAHIHVQRYPSYHYRVVRDHRRR